jgi:hypothetical protein
MPTVVNQTSEKPVELVKVEIGPGHFLKLSPADAAAREARLQAEAEQRAAYQALAFGGAEPEVTAPAGPAEVPLTVLTRAELVALAEARGLATSGNKPAIAARFAGGATTEEPEAPAAAGGPDGGAESGLPAGAAPDATAAAPDATPATE